MIFSPTAIDGSFLVEIEPHYDERGFFARTWCQEETSSIVTGVCFNQFSVSFNATRGTLRGLHYQVQPHEEMKLVRCTAGAIFDVLVDLRPQSPSYLAWFGAELSSENRTALYVPAGVAHGFVTLQDRSEVFYQIAGTYVKDAGSGIRWDDPLFSIPWPILPSVISERDRTYPNFKIAL